MFTVAMDWTPRGGGPVQHWAERRVPRGGFARFRCNVAGIELYVDGDGLVELRDVNDSAKVLYRRLGPDDRGTTPMPCPCGGHANRRDCPY